MPMFDRRSARSARHAVACSIVALSLGWTCASPASAAGIPLTSDNVAFGGPELAKPVTVSGGGKFTTLLTIPNVKLPTVKEARTMTSAAVSVANNGAGKVLVRLRLAINGVPDSQVFSTTIYGGAADT